MPRYPVEEALLREPNLWVPGKKPVGLVKIDWSLPITDAMSHCVLFINGVAHDLVTQEIPSIATQVFTVGEAGVAGKYSGSQYTRYDNIDGDFTGEEGTMAVFTSTTDTPSSVSMFSRGNTVGGTPVHGLLLKGSVASVFSRSTDGWLNFSIDGTITVNDGAPHMIVCPFDFTSGGTADLYVDGVNDGTEVTNLRPSEYNTMALGAHIKNSVVSYYTGNIYLFVDWKRKISISEVSSFTYDPYQFLIPA